MVLRTLLPFGEIQDGWDTASVSCLSVAAGTVAPPRIRRLPNRIIGLRYFLEGTKCSGTRLQAPMKQDLPHCYRMLRKLRLEMRIS